MTAEAATMEQIEAGSVGDIRRRQRFTRAEKMAIVRESHKPGARVAEVAARHQVSRSNVSLWRKQAAEGKLNLSPRASEPVPASEYRVLQVHVQELQRLLGRKTLEVELLRTELQAALRTS
jgi:transposase